MLRAGVLLIWCAVLAAAAPQVARIIQLAAAAVTAASRWLTDSDYPSPTGCVSNTRCLAGHRQRTPVAQKRQRTIRIGPTLASSVPPQIVQTYGCLWLSWCATSGKRGRIERPAFFRVWCGATLDCQLHFDTERLTYKPPCLPLSLFLRLSHRDSRTQLLNTSVVPKFLEKYHENYYHHHCYHWGCTAKKQT